MANLSTKKIKEIKQVLPQISVKNIRELHSKINLQEFQSETKWIRILRKFLKEKELEKKRLKKQKVLDKKLNSEIYWWKEAWDAFSLYIRNRDDWTCISCGKKLGDMLDNGRILTKKDMHAGHYIEQSLLTKYHKLNFDEANINCQCVSCNLWIESNRDKHRNHQMKSELAKRLQCSPSDIPQDFIELKRAHINLQT